MKYTLTIISLLLISNLVFGQIITSKSININNIKTLVSADGLLFAHEDSNYYEFPKGSGVNTLYATNIWLGGYDTSSTLKIAGNRHNFIPGDVNQWLTDFQLGFIGSDKEEMNQVWKITKEEIKALKRDFDDNNSIDEVIPSDILTYPAFGNPYVFGAVSGNAIPITVDYLPFFDRNNDNQYNVYDGDYPILEGDMQLFWIINDDRIHFASQGSPLEFDLVGSLYGNTCNGNDLVDNTLFLKYIGINRSQESLDSFYFALIADFDIGCPYNDFIGCIPHLNTFYAYNSNDNDALTSINDDCSGIPFYENAIPIQSITYLNQSLDKFTYYISGQVIPMSDPVWDPEFYNYMTGSWRDGVPFTNVGNGYGGSVPTNHIFYENPADSNSNNIDRSPISKKSIGSTNLMQFQPNEQQTIEMALITHPNVPHPKPDITPIENRITQLQNHYDNDLMNWDVYLGKNQTLQVGQSVTLTATTDNLNPTYSYLWSNGETTKTINVNTPNTYSITVTNNQTGCTKTDQIEVTFSEEELEQLTDFEKIIIYPNPANDVININFIALELPILNISIYDMTGKLIKSIVIENMDIQEIDVNDLNTGLYIFEFQNGVGEVIGHKKMMILD